MKKLLLIFLWLGVTSHFARGVEYEILSEPLRTAAAWINPFEWSYEIIEPSVTIKGKTYTVTTIKQNPINHHPDWISSASLVSIPATVRYIENRAFYGFNIGKFVFESDEPFESVGDFAFAFGYGLDQTFNLDLLPSDP